MAEISAQLVKQLRERTGAGMMECKSALVEAKGDLTEAEVILRKRGITSASKKSSRSTKQGVIGSYISENSKLGVIVEINCESDFVARTEDFQTLVSDVAHHITETNPTHVKLEEVTAAERENIKDHLVLYEQKFVKDANVTIADLVKTKIAKLGENINVSRFARYELSNDGIVGSYLHTGAQIGVLVEATTDKPQAAAESEFKELIRDVAMHVAAVDPQFISRKDVDEGALQKEREIQRDRALKEGKKEAMVDKIVEGRLGKFYEEVCLYEQPFVKENTVTVRELLDSRKAKLGTLEVVRFVRFKVGDAGDAPGVEPMPTPVTA